MVAVVTHAICQGIYGFTLGAGAVPAGEVVFTGSGLAKGHQKLLPIVGDHPIGGSHLAICVFGSGVIQYTIFYSCWIKLLSC